MKDVDLRGIIPAIVTPMTSEGELDLPALRRYVGWLAEQGPVALAVNVDTGEGPHLTADEKRQTLETVAEAVAGKCKVVGGVAGPSTAQGVSNARAAQAAGADAHCAQRRGCGELSSRRARPRQVHGEPGGRV